MNTQIPVYKQRMPNYEHTKGSSQARKNVGKTVL